MKRSSRSKPAVRHSCCDTDGPPPRKRGTHHTTHDTDVETEDVSERSPPSTVAHTSTVEGLVGAIAYTNTNQSVMGPSVTNADELWGPNFSTATQVIPPQTVCQPIYQDSAVGAISYSTWEVPVCRPTYHDSIAGLTTTTSRRTATITTPAMHQPLVAGPIREAVYFQGPTTTSRRPTTSTLSVAHQPLSTNLTRDVRYMQRPGWAEAPHTRPQPPLELEQTYAMGVSAPPPVEVAPAGDSNSDSSDDEYFPAAIRAHSDDIMRGNGVYEEALSTSISTQVPSSLQRRIWRHKFVDLQQLLPSHHLPRKSGKNFTFEIDKHANLKVVPQQEQTSITTIEVWTTAFIRFMAIYALKYPFETPALLKYMEMVRELARRCPGPAFLEYDTQFRKHRARHITFPWDRLHSEYFQLSTAQAYESLMSRLFRASSQEQSEQTKRSSTRPHKRPRYLSNTCFTYNDYADYNNTACPYPHVCGYCRGPHHAGRCPNRATDKPNTDAHKTGYKRNNTTHKPRRP